MKTKSRLFICLAALTVIISLTSCSGLFSGKQAGPGTAAASGMGRIVIDLGGARAAAGPEIEGFTVYLCPTTKSRSAYENYMMSLMAIAIGRINNSYLPENVILDTRIDTSKTYDVKTGYWFVFVIAGVEDGPNYYGFTTTLVSENETAEATLDMTSDLAFSDDFDPDFENTLYFFAVRDKYSEGEYLRFMPDASVIPEVDFNPKNSETALMEAFFLETMFQEDSNYKLSNIQERDGKLYADVTSLSYGDSGDSTFLSNAQIKYVTEYGVQLETGTSGYFLFTSTGVSEYLVWFWEASVINYAIANLKTNLGESYTEEIAETLKAEYEDSLEPVTAEIIIKEPGSLAEINKAVREYEGKVEDLNGNITITVGCIPSGMQERDDYLVILCPFPSNRSAKDNFQKLFPRIELVETGHASEEILDDAIMITDYHPGDLIENLATGNWFVLIGSTEDASFGYTNVQVAAGGTSNQKLDLWPEIDGAIKESYASDFESTLYYVSLKDDYQVSNENFEFCPDHIDDIYDEIPDLDDLLDPYFDGYITYNEMLIQLTRKMTAKETSCYKLTNFHEDNSKLFADVIRVSFTGADNSTYLTGAEIRYVTKYGIQLDVSGTPYFLFTLNGLHNTLFAPEFIEGQTDSFEAPIICNSSSPSINPESVSEIGWWFLNFQWQDEGDPQGENRIAANTNYASNFQDTKYVYYTTISGAVTKEETYFWPRSAFDPYAYTDITSDPIELNFFWKLDNFRITDSKLYADVMKCYFDETPAVVEEADVWVRRITNYGVIVTTTNPAESSYANRILLTANAGHVYIPTLPTNGAPDSNNRVDPYVIVDYFSEAGEDLDRVLTDIQGRLDSYTGNWPNGGQHQMIIQ